MQRGHILIPSALIIASLALAGCASRGAVTAGDGSAETPAPVESSEPDAGDAAALEQAQAWLDAANLPPGAVRTETPSTGFTSYTGWPCGPYEELEGYWEIPGMSLADAARWLIENPTADLTTTAYLPPGAVGESIDGVTIGYIPAPDAQEGIVYTLQRMDDGVAIRAEVAAQTGTATCPPLPDGGTYGAPGQG